MTTSPYAVKAEYTPQNIARMRDNPLIEALPPALSDEELACALMVLPDFSKEQRQWVDHERIQQIKGLGSFLVALENHLELARVVDTMLREGYVGRSPRTSKMQQKLQEIYGLQKAGKTFSQAVAAVGAQDSVSLIGMPGMGKSTAAKRSLALYPQVIDHGDNFVQITYIHVDMTSNGTSVKSLAIAIISEIDRLLPEHRYAELYLAKTSRTSYEALIHAAARLVTIHHVGIIIADEVQNLSPVKGVQTVMTELVTMCNTLKVPLVFIGTFKANKILGADFRSCRRATGGISTWGPLPRYDSGVLVPESDDEPSQWKEFVSILWKFQWVRNETELTEELLDYLHDRTQGVIDLVIKLFSIAQVRAITSGIEALSQDLLEAVYQDNFKLLHDALEGMRKGERKALERYADVQSLDADLAIRKYQAGAALHEQQALRPGADDFAGAVATLLVKGGMDADTAARLAEEANKSARSESPLQAVARIVKEVQPKLPRPTSGKKAAKVVYPDFGSRPQDYRRAVMLAAQRGTKVVDQLNALHMLHRAEDLVPVM